MSIKESRRSDADCRPSRRRVESNEEALAAWKNRLERLGGDRKGQYSIRVNQQWRVCFIWEGGDADDVEIVDDH